MSQGIQIGKVAERTGLSIDITELERVRFVMKNGEVVKK
jgi:hypothetical protein